MSPDQFLDVVLELRARFPTFHAAADRTGRVALCACFMARSRLIARVTLLPRIHAAGDQLPEGAVLAVERSTSDEERYFCRCRDILVESIDSIRDAIPPAERQRIEAEVISCEPSPEELAIIEATPLPPP